MTKRTLILALGFALAACTNAAPAAGQAADTTTPSYRRDALRVEPGFWSGRIVRGARGEHAIHLMPWTDLTTIVAGVDSAVSYAARFETKQRWGGGLYLLGTLVAAVPVARNRGWDSLEDRDLVIFIGGEIVALIGAMMMHSGAADLSRAVWWHNSQFAEPQPERDGSGRLGRRGARPAGPSAEPAMIAQCGRHRSTFTVERHHGRGERSGLQGVDADAAGQRCGACDSLLHEHRLHGR